MTTVYSSVVSFHTNPYTCGVARFNQALANSMKVPIKSISQFVASEEKLSLILDGEVKTYDEYLTGQVYQYTIYEIHTCDLGHQHKSVIESCGSYYDEGDCRDEGQSVLDHKMTLVQDEERYDSKHK